MFITGLAVATVATVTVAEPLPTPGAPRTKTKGRAKAGRAKPPRDAPRPSSMPARSYKDVEPRPRAGRKQTRRAKKPPPFWQTWERHDWLRWGVPTGFLLVLLPMYRSWRREAEAEFDHATQAGSNQTGPNAAARFHARPVFLPKLGQNFDPLVRVDDAIERFGEGPAANAAEQNAAKAELDDVLAAKVAAQAALAATVEMRRPDVGAAVSDRIVLPGEIGQHFDGLAGERVEWQAPISTPFHAEGRVLITNERMLAVFRQKTYSLFPPRLESVHRRIALPVALVTETTTAYRRRGIFLTAAAITVFFYPLGTTLALVAMALHFFARRPVLEVKAGYARHALPLSLGDLQEASRILSKSKAAAAPDVKVAS